MKETVDPLARVDPGSPAPAPAAADAQTGTKPEPGGTSGPQATRRATSRRRRVGARPSWWNSQHPTFVALTGFYTGVAFAIVVPGGFAAVLAAVVGQDRAESLFPLVLATLAIPLVLTVLPRTRRFGTYMWIGLVLTLVVVLGVAAAVLAILYATSGSPTS